MNTFLQRMLKRSDDEDGSEKILHSSQKEQVECSPRSSKYSWMKKFGSYSPSKRELSPSVKSAARPIASSSAGRRSELRRRAMPESLTVPKESVEMPDLEKIILEFEEGYLSPTKREPKKSGRFVKQIVEAYEKKYKAYNNFAFQDDSEISVKEPEGVDIKTQTNEESPLEKEEEEEDSADVSGETYVIRSTMESQFHSDMDISEAKSETSLCRSNDSIDLGMCSFEMDEELTVSTPENKSKESSTPHSMKPRSMLLDESTTPKSSQKKPLLRSNSSLKRERQPKIVGAFLKKPIEVDDTSVDWIPIVGKKLPRKSSFKRLLAILTGKKWPEDEPELYNSQPVDQNESKSENVKELQDSGYEEKSSPSSSTSSLVSVAEILQHQESYEIERNRRKPLTTFKRSRALAVLDNENEMSTAFRESFVLDAKQFCEDLVSTDGSSQTSSGSSKKLFLEEVPRSEVRLSLGPAFPLGPRPVDVKQLNSDKTPDFNTDALSNISDDEVYHMNWQLTSSPASPMTSSPASPMTSLPASPMTSSPGSPTTSSLASSMSSPRVSPLPKHPFVSLKSREQLNINDEKDINFNYFNKDEPAKAMHTSNLSLAESFYDIPRVLGNVKRYMSRSEPGLVTVGRGYHKPDKEVIYDIPTADIPRRPRSSVFEDAVSLKRRTANLSHLTPGFDFYAFPNEDGPHYATVKPRNRKVSTSRVFMRSMDSLTERDIAKNQARAYDIRTF